MSRRAQLAHPVESGLAWSSVADRHGREYLTDELNHRVVVQDVAGRAWTFGEHGRGAGELRFPRGLAVRSGVSREATRVFVADSRNHRVQVFDGRGRPVFAFGAYGSGEGQFRAPAGLAIASPKLPLEGERGEREAADVLVVADQWNARLQVFTLDGVWLATLDSRQPGGRDVPAPVSSPFFRLGSTGVPRDPVRLSWQAPLLSIAAGNGRVHQIDLAVAMLPTFEQWLLMAPDAERAHAKRYFGLLRHGQSPVPMAVLHNVLNTSHSCWQAQAL